MTAPVRLLIADDHPVVREGLIGIFARQPGFDVIGQAADGEETVRLALLLQPDVILMDLRMPGLDGLAALTRLNQAQPGMRVIVLTSHDNEQDVRAALAAGALGYLLKDSPREVLHDAVIAAMQGRTTLSPHIYQHMVQQLRSPASTLTDREIAVLALAARGNTNKAIGQHLHISEATVKTHLKHIYAKLNVTDRAAAVAVAIQRSLIRLDDTIG